MNTDPNKEGSESENLEATSEELKGVSGGQGEDFQSNQGEDFKAQQGENLKFKPTIWVGGKKE